MRLNYNAALLRIHDASRSLVSTTNLAPTPTRTAADTSALTTRVSIARVNAQTPEAKRDGVALCGECSCITATNTHSGSLLCSANAGDNRETPAVTTALTHALPH